MRIAICDDDKTSINDIQKNIRTFSDDTGIIFEENIFTSAEALLESESSLDIAILDVEMDGMNGIRLGEILRQKMPHIILIYITAHKKYLDDALNLNAVRFFEKPIDSQRFYRGLKDSIERIDNSTIVFYLKDKSTTERIQAKDIIYVEIINRKTKVITTNKEYYSNETMDFWHEHLRNSIFVSPHKSYIVNLNFITSYKRDYIMINNSQRVNIARSKQSTFYRQFMRFMEGK